MAILQRVESVYTPWTPSAAGLATEEEYVGRHRKPGLRRIGLLSMFYTGAHRRSG